MVRWLLFYINQSNMKYEIKWSNMKSNIKIINQPTNEKLDQIINFRIKIKKDEIIKILKTLRWERRDLIIYIVNYDLYLMIVWHLFYKYEIMKSIKLFIISTIRSQSNQSIYHQPTISNHLSTISINQKYINLIINKIYI